MKSYKEAIIANFSKSAPEYDQHAGLQKQMCETIFSSVTKKHEKILDIGCGTGFLASKLAEKYPSSEIIGLDIAPGMIKHASSTIKYSNASFIEGDGENLPFPDFQFDLVLSSAALQWMDEEKAIFEAARILKPKGSFIFSTFGPNTLYELKEAGLSVNEFPSKEELERLLVKYFKSIKIGSEIIINNYKSPFEVLSYLKEIGAHHSNNKNHKGLITKNKILSLFPDNTNSTKFSFEIYYGFCIK